MIIRAETTDDIPAIRDIVAAAFGQPAEAGLVDALRQSGDAVMSLVADESGRISGHILFSNLQTPENCIALAPVSVAPDRQNQGIGSALIREGLARARQSGWRAVFLLGEPEYYQRFGFSVALADRFETPYPKPYVMALELTPGALDQCAGNVTYAPPFLDL